MNYLSTSEVSHHCLLFQVPLKKYFKTPIKLFNFGNRRENIIHCQLRNNTTSLNGDHFDDFIREN